jgi:hypothetical protein
MTAKQRRRDPIPAYPLWIKLPYTLFVAVLLAAIRNGDAQDLSNHTASGRVKLDRFGNIDRLLLCASQSSATVSHAPCRQRRQGTMPLATIQLGDRNIPRWVVVRAYHCPCELTEVDQSDRSTRRVDDGDIALGRCGQDAECVFDRRAGMTWILREGQM